MGKEKDQQDKHLNFCNATFMSALFLVLYIPFNTCQNTMSQIQKENGFGNLGFLVIGILYFAQMFGSLVSAQICSKIGLQWTFVVGALTMVIIIYTEVISAWRAERIEDGTPDPDN